MRTAENTARPRPDIGLRVLETMQGATNSGLIGLDIFPILMVNEMEGSYPVISIDALHNVPDDKRQSDGGYNRGDYEKEYGGYRTVDRGLEARVSLRDAKFHGSLVEAQMVAAQLKTMEMMRNHEVRVSAKTMDTTKFTAVAAAALWSAAAAKPRNDVEKGKRALRKKGIIPNVLAFDWEIFSILCENADVQATVYQLFPDAAKDGTINLSHLEAYFKMPVKVAGQQKNTKPPGEATGDLTPVWDTTKVWLGKIRADGSMDPAMFDYANPHVGNTILYNEGQSLDEPFLAEDYPEESKRSDIIRVRAELVESYTQSLEEDLTPKSEVYKRCGYIITGVQA